MDTIQIERLWRWCGFEKEDGRKAPKNNEYPSRWQHPLEEGWLFEALPSVSLANLERFAFPRLAEKRIGWELERQGVSGSFLCILRPGIFVHRRGAKVAEVMALAILDYIDGTVQCATCSKWFHQDDARQRHCSNACKQKAWRLRNKAKGGKP